MNSAMAIDDTLTKSTLRSTSLLLTNLFSLGLFCCIFILWMLPLCSFNLILSYCVIHIAHCCLRCWATTIDSLQMARIGKEFHHQHIILDRLISIGSAVCFGCLPWLSSRQRHTAIVGCYFCSFAAAFSHKTTCWKRGKGYLRQFDVHWTKFNFGGAIFHVPQILVTLCWRIWWRQLHQRHHRRWELWAGEIESAKRSKLRCVVLSLISKLTRYQHVAADGSSDQCMTSVVCKEGHVANS